MSEVARGWRYIGLAAVMSAAAMTTGAQVAAESSGGGRAPAPPGSRVDGFATCSSTSREGPIGEPQMEPAVDASGWLSGYRLTATGLTEAVELGRHATLHGPFGRLWIYSDAVDGSTRSRVLDAGRGCVQAVVDTKGLIFAITMDETRTSIFHDLVDPTTRQDLGVWRHGLASPFAMERVMPGMPVGSSYQGWSHSLSWTVGGSLLSETCGQQACTSRVAGDVPGDISIGGSVLLPAPEPREVESKPVPESERDVWPDDKILRFRWADTIPPSWMRGGILAAAADVAESRESNAPSFTYDAQGPDTVRITSRLTGSCSQALACATRDIPHYWVVRFRPHGYEFPWGTLRWCEAYGTPPTGCFELERTAIHEFGHVIGLGHPADAMRLGPLETVMHDTIPARPATGWSLHEFGPCDVARLQRRYALPHSGARLAVCDRVETALAVRVSDTAIGFQDPVTVTATLSVKDRDAYDRLAKDPLSGRDVVIQRRSIGATGWTSYRASPGSSPGSYQVTFRPSLPTEFRAVLSRASDDGVTDATSGVVAVFVGTCSVVGCPVDEPRSTAWRH
ncbi:MAG: hypothetical protein H0V36_11610 [Chloroflexi bacterium]|nr:hypothetical protein [Chloroflexota bacterium]